MQVAVNQRAMAAKRCSALSPPSGWKLSFLPRSRASSHRTKLPLPSPVQFAYLAGVFNFLNERSTSRAASGPTDRHVNHDRPRPMMTSRSLQRDCPQSFQVCQVFCGPSDQESRSLRMAIARSILITDSCRIGCRIASVVDTRMKRSDNVRVSATRYSRE